MSGLATLRTQATLSASNRGHALLWRRPHHGEARSYQIGYCAKCGKEVCVNTKPQPNEIDIGGEAVALNCTSKPVERLRHHVTGAIERGEKEAIIEKR